MKKFVFGDENPSVAVPFHKRYGDVVNFGFTIEGKDIVICYVHDDGTFEFAEYNIVDYPILLTEYFQTDRIENVLHADSYVRIKSRNK